MKNEDLDLFLEYKKYINSIGKDMPVIFQNLLKNIMSTQKYRFLLAVLMGTEAIKIRLRGLLILDDYIAEIKSYSFNKGLYSIKKMKEYSEQSYGQTLYDFLNKYKSLEPTHKKLFENLKTLNEKRVNIAHHSIIEYKGDIEKADVEIKPYIITQVMDDIQNELTTLINLKAEELIIEQEKLKKLGLF